MSYQPVIVGSGLVGWRFLQATYDAQRKIFNQDTAAVRDTDYFAEKIADVSTAQELVNDRRLLGVALGAFGLSDDLDNKFFVQTILEEGVTDRQSLANKLTDERYRSLSKAFGFDNVFGPKTKRDGFAGDIIAKYQTQRFEIAVGEQDDSLRLALNFERQISEIAGEDISDNAKWFKVMGSTPLRKVFETALNLPTDVGQLDLDSQLTIFRDKLQSRFGLSEITDLADTKTQSKIVQSFSVQQQVRDLGQTSTGQTALILLANLPRWSSLY